MTMLESSSRKQLLRKSLQYGILSLTLSPSLSFSHPLFLPLSCTLHSAVDASIAHGGGCSRLPLFVFARAHLFATPHVPLFAAFISRLCHAIFAFSTLFAPSFVHPCPSPEEIAVLRIFEPYVPLRGNTRSLSLLSFASEPFAMCDNCSFSAYTTGKVVYLSEAIDQTRRYADSRNFG